MKDLSIADLYAILNAGANIKDISKFPDTVTFVEAVRQELANRLGTLQVEVNLRK
jgi:hypothetical protein